MKKVISAFLLLNALAFSAAAENQELSIQDALTAALQNNPTLSAQRQQLDKARAAKIQADGNFTPSLSLTGQYSENYPDTTNNGRTDSRTAGITVVQNLYSGGKHVAQKRQAQESMTQAEFSVRESEEELAVKIYTNFFGVILAREKVTAAQDAVETSRQHVRQVRQMLQLGLSNQLEVIRAEQQLSENEASVVTASTELEKIRVTLFNLMGLPPSTPKIPQGSLEVANPAGTVSESLETAKANRSDLGVLEKEIEIQKQQIRIVKSGVSPKIDLGATVGYSNPYQSKDQSKDTWKAYVSLEIPLYDRAQTRGEVLKAEAVQKQNVLTLQQKHLDIVSEIELAWFAINNSSAQVVSRRKAYGLAKETLRLSEVGYREGVTPQLDLLNAQASLTSARKDYSQALYNHLICIATLKRAEGILVPWTLEGAQQKQ
ncbi:MAG: TolC family protein [Pyramidobacter sp.]|nr:TolC family protein [Pyramidobacter sp.]